MIKPTVQSGTVNLDLNINKGQMTIPINISGGKVVNYYDGVYEITPNAHADIELQTKRKAMRENVIVYKIPYAETTNEKGGLTAVIGE